MTNASNFLQELYDIDPSLRAHEAELLPLIEQLLEVDPGVAPDEDFVAALRVSLHEHAATLKTGQAHTSLWNNLLYTLGGMAVSAAAFFIAVSTWNGTPGGLQTASDSKAPTSPLFAFQVTEEAPESFGTLQTDNANQTGAPMARPHSGGGGPGLGGGGGGMPTMDAALSAVAPEGKMIAPWPMVRYRYVYDGALPALEDTVGVYRRDPNAGRLSLGALGSSLDLGTIDLGSFAGLNVQSISLNQDRDFGYQLYVDLQNAQVSLNAQWDTWPMAQCRDDKCWEAQRVAFGDVLSDDRVITIAKEFLTAHGISLEHYGDPKVDNAWRRDYERATDKSLVYIPDTQRVIFPLSIDGQPVYDQGGMPAGLSIGISVKYERVMDIYGLGDQTYAKSAYAGVTDADAIKDMIANTDQWPVGIMEREDSAKAEEATATVTLGEPTHALVTYYDYQGTVSQELLVPSLVFPIKSVTGDNAFLYRQNVVVPLAKQIFDQQGTTGQPMPLEDGPAVMPAEAPSPEIR